MMYPDDPFENVGSVLLVLLVLFLGYLAPGFFAHLIGPHDLYHRVVQWAFSQPAWFVLPFCLFYEAVGVGLVLGTWFALIAIGRLLFEIIADLSMRAWDWGEAQAERAAEAVRAGFTAGLALALMPVGFVWDAMCAAFAQTIGGIYRHICEEADLRRAYRTEYRERFASFRDFKDALNAANGKPSGAQQRQHQEQSRTEQKKTTSAGPKHSAHPRPTLDPIDFALAMFGLPRECTEADLKRRYKDCMKRAHPDLGGSADHARLYIDAYKQIKQRKGWT